MRAKKTFRNLWKRSEDGPDREKRSFMRTVIVGSALFALFMCLKKDNVFIWLRAEREIASQEALITRNDSQIERTRRHLDALKTNVDSLERFARETFRFCAPGEDVYILQK